MIRNLLIPLDGFHQSETVGRWAGRFAGVIGAQVTLLGVVSPKNRSFGDIPGVDVQSASAEADPIESAAESYFGKIAEEMTTPDLKPSVIIRTGNPDTEIPNAAAELSSDAVVLATRRASALSRAVLGSVTDRVIRSAAVPIIATNPESTITLVSSPDVPSQIIVTLDGSELSEAAVGPAIDLASQAGSKILFVRALAGAFASERGDQLRKERNECLDYLGEFKQRATDAGIDSDCRVTSGSPPKTIIDASKADSSSLIMMTTHGRTGFRRAVLGSVADQVLRSAAVPVIVLPPPR